MTATLTQPQIEALLGAPGACNAIKVARLLANAGHPTVIVGGAVRDLFLGKTPKDIDLATAAQPLEVAGLLRAFPEHGFTFEEVGGSLSHGVAVIRHLDSSDFIEVATFRTETPAGDGRHAVVEYTQDLRADLARRDFTINALALDPTNFTVIDPFGGLLDIKNRKIRAVGNPTVRFAEDNLRALRLLRFVDKLGFSVDPETLTAATNVLRNAGLTTFSAVSTERIAQEVLQTSTFQGFSRGAPLALTRHIITKSERLHSRGVRTEHFRNCARIVCTHNRKRGLEVHEVLA